MDFISDVFDSIQDAISDALSRFVGRLLYYLSAAVCYLVKVVYRFFGIFSGMERVSYNGEKEYLINLFFGNEKISQIYWGMSLIGITFVIVFCIIAVIRKTFDLGDKQQTTLGGILMSGGKSILAIVALTAVLTAILNLTNVVVKQVNYLFDNAGEFDLPDSKVFTDEEFATMARIYNTIGNYSLNESYESRYNLNSCYNAIRSDLMLLQEDGVFDYHYDNDNGNSPTWQSELEELVISADPRYEMPMDQMTGVDAKLLKIMETLRTNEAFYPVSSVERKHVDINDGDASLDRIIFLMGTLDAANNSAYNVKPSLQDTLRGPFYTGESDIYSFSQVNDAFDISMSGISYLMVILIAFFTLKNLVVCVFNCIARIFSLLGLYIIAPPIIAVSPLDGGEKFKQWITSATVQMFGIFGCIIPMRLIIIFIPMIFDADLVMFSDSAIMNILAKGVLLLGGIEAATRFNSIVTGILANSAGMQTIQAGDMGGFANRVMNFTKRTAGTAAGVAAKASGVYALGHYVGGKASGAWDYLSNKGGLLVGSGRAIYGWATSGKKAGGDESGGNSTDGGDGGDSGNKPVPDEAQKE